MKHYTDKNGKRYSYSSKVSNEILNERIERLGLTAITDKQLTKLLEPTAEQIHNKAKNDLRAERDNLLKNLEVKHNNNIYQADRISLGYIKDIIADLSSNETIDFILKNNEVITITENELKKVLGKARTKTTQIKLEYNQKIKDLNEN